MKEGKRRLIWGNIVKIARIGKSMRRKGGGIQDKGPCNGEKKGIRRFPLAREGLSTGQKEVNVVINNRRNR